MYAATNSSQRLFILRSIKARRYIMSPKDLPGSPQDWLARVKSDLILARLLLPEGAFYEDPCFHT